MAKQQKERIPINSRYSDIEKLAIGQDIIDAIFVRTTEKGVYKNGNKFAPYSKEYKNSTDFKAAGKSSKVNLTLSGDMLDDLKVLSIGSDYIEIGYDKGSDENGKVEGNRLGTYGNSKPVSAPRDFLGLTDNALKALLRDYPLRSTTKKSASDVRQESVDEVIASSEFTSQELSKLGIDLDDF